MIVIANYLFIFKRLIKFHVLAWLIKRKLRVRIPSQASKWNISSAISSQQICATKIEINEISYNDWRRILCVYVTFKYVKWVLVLKNFFTLNKFIRSHLLCVILILQNLDRLRRIYTSNVFINKLHTCLSINTIRKWFLNNFLHRMFKISMLLMCDIPYFSKINVIT